MCMFHVRQKAFQNGKQSCLTIGGEFPQVFVCFTGTWCPAFTSKNSHPTSGTRVGKLLPRYHPGSRITAGTSAEYGLLIRCGNQIPGTCVEAYTRILDNGGLIRRTYSPFVFPAKSSKPWKQSAGSNERFQLAAPEGFSAFWPDPALTVPGFAVSPGSERIAAGLLVSIIAFRFGYDG